MIMGLNYTGGTLSSHRLSHLVSAIIEKWSGKEGKVLNDQQYTAPVASFLSAVLSENHRRRAILPEALVDGGH
jgi:hypothetical protein